VSYLISQIAVSLLLAGIVGGVIGWLLHRVRASRTIAHMQGVINRQEQQVSQAKTDVTILTDDYEELRQRSQEEVSQLQQEVRKLPALNQNLEKSQLLVRQLLQKHEAETRELTAEKEQLSEALKDAKEQLLAKPESAAESAPEPEPVEEKAAPADTESSAEIVESDDAGNDSENTGAITAQETAQELEELQSQLSDDGPNELDDVPQMFEPVEQHDDLKQIFGIGPVTEKTLNKLGITSYSQLAELKQHDIEKIADAMQIFPGRIERDDWVGGARAQLEAVLADL
jgi:predicted flap endonuclease-1-like 5' DNA nuclease